MVLGVGWVCWLLGMIFGDCVMRVLGVMRCILDGVGRKNG